FRQDLGGELCGLDAAELPPVGPLGPGPSDRLTHPFLPLWVPAASAFLVGGTSIGAGAEREHPAGFEIAEGPREFEAVLRGIGEGEPPGGRVVLRKVDALAGGDGDRVSQ